MLRHLSLFLLSIIISSAAFAQDNEYRFVIVSGNAMMTLKFDGKKLTRTLFLYNDIAEEKSFNISGVVYYPEDGVAFYTCDRGIKDEVCGQVFSDAKGENAFFMFGTEDNPHKTTHQGEPHSKFAAAYQRLKKAVQNGAFEAKPGDALRGQVLQLDKMLGTPFGYKPVKGRPYTPTDICQAAKAVWGWDVPVNTQTKSAGFTWPQLDGMTFLGYPVYKISAFGSKADFFLSNFYCTLIVPNTKAAKQKVRNAVINYFQSRGWKRVYYENTENLYFYKGNVTVNCYTYDADKFPGKIEFNIDADSFPTAKDVQNRIEGGLG